MKLDILAFGVHPDDVELGCGGYLISEVKNGKKVGIVDLTQGEMGSNGTPETRLQEATKAATVMGLAVRENLKMQDVFFKNDAEHQLQVVQVIRKFQPEIVICNVLHDRHPDHGRAGRLVADACFYAGLRKIVTKDEAGKEQEKWRPKMVWHYIQHNEYVPNFVVDITDVIEKKMEAVLAYTSQFNLKNDNKDSVKTILTSPEFLETVRGRAIMTGKLIGVQYAEGFVSEKMVGIKNMDSLILKTI